MARGVRGTARKNSACEADYFTRAVEHFEASLKRDASYAQAHAGLAEAYVTLGIYGVRPPAEVMPAAKAAAERALAIDPPLPGALATLGCVHAPDGIGRPGALMRSSSTSCQSLIIIDAPERSAFDQASSTATGRCARSTAASPAPINVPKKARALSGGRQSRT
jgi:hypothetical protein